MANQFLDHVWVIDTAFTTGSPGTDKSGDTVAPITARVAFNLVRWVDDAGAAAGNRVTIADKDGNVVWEAAAEGAQVNVESWGPIIVEGLRVPLIQTGRLYLYLDINRVNS